MGRHAAPRAHAWAALPRWRRPGLGWVFLHVLFGLGLLGLGHIVLAGLAILELRPPGTDPTFTARLVSWSALGAGILVTFAGWLLFVYLRRSQLARWTTLLGLLLLGAAVNLGGQLLATRVVTG